MLMMAMRTCQCLAQGQRYMKPPCHNGVPAAVALERFDLVAHGSWNGQGQYCKQNRGDVLNKETGSAGIVGCRSAIKPT
jgi:hypothetical protein